LTSRTLAKRIAEFILSRKGDDVVLMDLTKLAGPANYFVLCSAESDTQVRAIADAVRTGTNDIGVSLWHMEGLQALSWVLLDYVDVVVHIFQKETRSFYHLERLWSDAKIYPVEDAPHGIKVARKALSKVPRKRIAGHSKNIVP
jgi:ribosome-associated protein